VIRAWQFETRLVPPERRTRPQPYRAPAGYHRVNTDMYVEMTLDKARAIAEALLELADTAEGADDEPG